MILDSFYWKTFICWQLKGWAVLWSRKKRVLGGNIIFSPIFEARCLDFVVLALYATLNIIAFQSTFCIQQTGCINRQSTDFLGGSGRSMPSPNNYSYVIFELHLKRSSTAAKKQVIINLPYKLLANTTKIFIFIILWWYKHLPISSSCTVYYPNLYDKKPSFNGRIHQLQRK